MINSTTTARLTRDPELKFLEDGTAVCEIFIATDDRKGDAQFGRVTVWARRGEKCAEHLTKGQQVTVTGPLEVRAWATQDGAPRASIEITADRVEFGPKPRSTGEAEQPSAEAPADDEKPF